MLDGGLWQEASGIDHVLQAVMQSKKEAQQLLDMELRVDGRPVRVVKWTHDGCKNLEELDISLYWVLLPGLPTQYVDSLKRIGDSLGQFIA